MTPANTSNRNGSILLKMERNGLCRPNVQQIVPFHINDEEFALTVVDTLKKVPQITDKPTAIVSQTKKGFGILPVLETTGDVNYHGKPLSKELAEKALALLA